MAKKIKQKSNYKLIIFLWLLFLTPPLAIVLVVTSVRYTSELPDTKTLRNPKTSVASEIYSSDLVVLGKYYKENRTIIDFHDISPNVINALLATEDIRFYEHSGIDFRALGRVVYGVITNNRKGGGSTISQQLAKMLFPRERLRGMEIVFRKVKEWIIAVKLEREYTKNEILAMYLNKFDFVNNAVGIKSAAQIYFSTTPDALNIQEAALLVGMAKNPSLYNPNRFIERSTNRRNTVLDQMKKYKYITASENDSLKNLPIELKFHRSNHSDGLAPYFREYLRDVFLKQWCKINLKPDGSKYNIYTDGLKIYTTIDSRMQRYAEESVTEHLTVLQEQFDIGCLTKRNAPFSWNVTQDEIKGIMSAAIRRSERYRVLKKGGLSKDSIYANFDVEIPMKIFSWKGEIDTVLSPKDSIRYYKGILQTGFMSMSPHTGHIKAWVGGINHKHFKYDHVQIGHSRQVGSTFKPFLYALAIDNGWSPCKKVPNVKVCIDMPLDQPDYCPQNSDDTFEGEMISLQKALANSINYVSTLLIKEFGPHAVTKLAKQMGIVSDILPVPSICLGTPEISVYEMVGAQATFANKGKFIKPVFITRIEDKNGKVLVNFSPETREVLTEEKAYLMLHLMKGVVRHGTGIRLRYKYKMMNPIAGKTGTTQNHSDGWFMGLTPDLVSGCWTGAEDRAVHFDNIKYGQGANMALPIWALYMQKVYADSTLDISQGDFKKPHNFRELDLDCDNVTEEFNTDNDDPEAFEDW